MPLQKLSQLLRPIFICGIAIVALATCSREPGQIRIGIIALLDGEDARTSGRPTLNTATMAVNAVNGAGGLDVGGRKYKLNLVVEGIQSNPETAVNAARKLIYKEGVAVLIGPQYSRDAIPVARLAEEARIPMISPMSTNPETTAGKRYVFRVGFVDDFQGWVMAHFTRRQLNARTASVLYDVASAYNKGIAGVFKQAFEADGGKVTAFETYTTDDAEDFSGQLNMIKKSGAEVLFLPNYPRDVAVQVRQARQMGLKAAIIGSDSWDATIFPGQAEFEDTFFSGHWHTDLASEQSRAFVEKYTKIYGQVPSDTAALTWDAFGLLFQAIKTQGKADSESIRTGLYAMGPYNGVSGTIDYLSNGDPVKSAVIVTIKDGKGRFFQSVDPPR